jgi:hypothetical protein
MENQVKIYDYLDFSMQEYDKHEWFENPKLNYFLIDGMSNLKIEDNTEIIIILNQYFSVYSKSRISNHQNFKKIYHFNGINLQIDFKISSPESYLVIINCNPSNETAVQSQLHFALNRFQNN